MVNNKNNGNSTKSICTILNRRINEIYDALDRGVSLEELNAVVISCIDEAKASGNDSADEAKRIFNSIVLRGNYNHYLTTLVTYMTCINC